MGFPPQPTSRSPISVQLWAPSCCLSSALAVLVSHPFSGLVYWVDLGVAFLLEGLLGHMWWTISMAILYCILPRSPLSARAGWRKYKVFLNSLFLSLKCLKGLYHHQQCSGCRWWWHSNVLWSGVRCGGSWESRTPCSSIEAKSHGVRILASNWECLLMIR